MDGKHFDTDVLVIGAGPSGCASAIWCAMHNLKVIIVEQKEFPRHKPGETLHPGISVLFRHLGVEQKIKEVSYIRHSGYHLVSSGDKIFTEFGKDENGKWEGFQILREDLDFILLNRAKEFKVPVLQPVKAISVIVDNNRVKGVRTTKGEIRAKYIIDACGGHHWLKKQLDLDLINYSKPLVVEYGYVEGNLSHKKYLEPVFKITDTGWLWVSMISEGRYNWTKLSLETPYKKTRVPDELAGMKATSKVSGSDVTWRHIPNCADYGYFMTGDSCIVFDPSSSKGVLRAIYSAIIASDTIIKIINNKVLENDGIEFYRHWIKSWFDHDLKVMSDFYHKYDLRVRL